MTATDLRSLETPSLILDLDQLMANIDRMAASVDRLGVALRPHLKTAKSAVVGDLATHGKRDGITVSTLREAEYFANHGFTDITYAIGIAPAKLDRAAALIARGIDLKVIADTCEAAQAVADHGAGFKLLIEIDTGDHRAGVAPDSPILLDIAAILKASNTATLEGVLTHAGHSYACRTIPDMQRVAEDERRLIVQAADRLRAAGYDVRTVSAGSTPTALFSQDATGLTEYRAGVYVFFDLDQQARNACTREEVAMSVLSTVIGHNRDAGKILLDAGGLALSKDTGANHFRPEVGYGEVCDVDGTVIPGLFVSGVSQEHGHVPVDDPARFDQLPVGSQVRILPNHACMTAAAYEEYHVLQGGRVVAQWDRCNGW